MAFKDPTDYAFGQLGSIHVAGTEAITIIGGDDTDATPASNVNRITKVFVAITFLEDTVFDSGATGLVPAEAQNFPSSDGNSTDIDADGGDVTFKDGGTEFGNISNSSSDMLIQSAVSDKDMIFKGNDGGSTITALTLDMSAAGAATFNDSITAGADITAFSDMRIKHDIQTIEGALAKVSDMRGVYFKRNNGEAGTGVIAQEIENILPEVVKDGEYKSVAYGNMVGILIEAIKELKAEVEKLKESK